MLSLNFPKVEKVSVLLSTPFNLRMVLSREGHDCIEDRLIRDIEEPVSIKKDRGLLETDVFVVMCGSDFFKGSQVISYIVVVELFGISLDLAQFSFSDLVPIMDLFWTLSLMDLIFARISCVFGIMDNLTSRP